MKDRLNLIPKEFIESEKLGLLQKKITYLFLCLFLMIFIFSVFQVIATVNLKNEKIRIQVQKDIFESQINSINQKISALTSTASEKVVEDPLETIALQVSLQSQWWTLLRDFGRTVPKTVNLTLLEISEQTPSLKEIKISGVTAEYFSLPNFLLNLQKLPVKGDFQLVKTSKAEKGKGIIFEIKGVLQ